MNKKKGPDGIGFIHTPDSVTLKRNAKGDYAWDIKIYMDTDGGTNKAEIKALKKIKEIDIKLEKQYGN